MAAPTWARKFAARCKLYGITQRAVSERAGYTKGYTSQLIAHPNLVKGDTAERRLNAALDAIIAERSGGNGA